MSETLDRESRRQRRRDSDSDSQDYDTRKDDSTKVRSHSHRKSRRDDDERYRSRDNDRRDDDSRRDRRYRDRSRSQERSRHHHRRSRSPPAKRRRRSDSLAESAKTGAFTGKSRGPLPSQEESFRGGNEVSTADGQPASEKQKPNFKPTGLLAKEANTVAGTTTVLKYHEPPEARKPPPKEQWRMYVFKKKDLLDTIYLHERSVWLLGRDQKVTDYLLEHPSTSKQHAVIQFRYITSTNEYGDKTSRVKPYLIDLDSANGSKLNGKKIEASRFVELRDGDVLGFGDSEREYVLMLPSEA